MLTTEHPWTDTETAARTAEYALRLDGGLESEQLISIPRGKHSIGSGPRCSLRLQYAGVQPLECLIVHDEEGLRVRRWSDATLVNGQAFDDVRLAAGDVLSLGPLDLEVVASQSEGQEDGEVDPIEDAWDSVATVVESASESADVPLAEAPAVFEIETQALQPVEANTDWDSVATSSESESTTGPVENETTSTAQVAEPERPTEKPHDSRRSRRLLVALRRQRQEHDELAARVDDLARKIEQALAEPLATPVALDAVPAEASPTAEAADDSKFQTELLTAELGIVRDQLAARDAEIGRARYSIDVLERQLIDSQHTMHAFAEERVTWEEQFNELEARLADYVGRIQDLELQLDQVRASQAEVGRADGETTPPTQNAFWADEASSTETVSDELLDAETVAAVEEPPAVDTVDTSVQELTSAEVVADPSPENADAIVLEDVAEPVAPSASEVVVREEGVTEEGVSEDVVAEEGAEVDAALDHLRGLSIWREEPGAAAEPGREEASPAPVEEPAEASAAEPASFIDRYSHLFPAEDEAAAPPVAPHPAVVAPVEHAHDMHGHTDAHADEESVEQYMSRLLERMRGTSAPTSDRGDNAANESSVASPKTDVSLANEPEVADAPIQEPITDLEEIKPRVAAPDQTHSLAAMRALANQSARQAIGVHTYGRLRRAARTQSIVALLGAAVGVYLLIDAPHWQTLQFAAGCVAGLVALYWGKLTFMTIIEGIRMGAFDDADGEIDPEKSLHPPLPIDVERPAADVEPPTAAEQKSTYTV